MESKTLSITERRLEAIRRHSLYQTSMHRLLELEQSRIFCRHGMEHLLDVARIAYIRSLERELPLSQDLIYAAALLHDIGKWRQYEDGTPHELASEQIAGEILWSLPESLRFSSEETRQILTAIRGHRRLRPDPEPLEALLYESDKASRACFCCPALDECNWSDEKKNMEINI